MDINSESIKPRAEYNKLLLMLQQKELTLATIALHNGNDIICIVG